MRVIPTKIHGVMDYLMAVVLLAAPAFLALNSGSREGLVLIDLGVVTVIYSLLTRYELGLFRVLPMPAHLGLDLLSGVFLATSPWLLGFADRIYLPHLVLGLIEIGAALLSETHSRAERVATPA